jgi:hypothetical protein
LPEVYEARQLKLRNMLSHSWKRPITSSMCYMTPLMQYSITRKAVEAENRDTELSEVLTITISKHPRQLAMPPKAVPKSKKDTINVSFLFGKNRLVLNLPCKLKRSPLSRPTHLAEAPFTRALPETSASTRISDLPSLLLPPISSFPPYELFPPTSASSPDPPSLTLPSQLRVCKAIHNSEDASLPPTYFPLTDDDEGEDASRTVGSVLAGGDGWASWYVQFKGEDGVWEDVTVEIPGNDDEVEEEDGRGGDVEMREEPKKLDKGKGRAT